MGRNGAGCRFDAAAADATGGLFASAGPACGVYPGGRPIARALRGSTRAGRRPAGRDMIGRTDISLHIDYSSIDGQIRHFYFAEAAFVQAPAGGAVFAGPWPRHRLADPVAAKPWSDGATLPLL